MQCVAVFVTRGTKPSMSVLHHKCDRSDIICFAFRYLEFYVIEQLVLSFEKMDYFENIQTFINVTAILPRNGQHFGSLLIDRIITVSALRRGML